MKPSRSALGFFALCLMLYTLTAGGHLYSPDEEVIFRTTQALFEHGGLSVEPIADGFGTRPGRGGHEYGQYGVGQPLLALPFYALGRALAPSLSESTWRRLYGLESEGGGAFFDATADEIAPRMACSFFNVVVGAGVATILFLLLIELTGRGGASLAAAGVYAFGTLAWPHTRPFYNQQLSLLFMLLAWWGLARGRRGGAVGFAALAGVSVAVAAMVRLQSVLLLPGLIVLALGPFRRGMPSREASRRAAAAFAGPILLGGVAIALLNWRQFGGPFASGYADQPEGIRFDAPLLAGLYGLLLSAGKGLFYFSPPLALSFAGWRPLGRAGRSLAAGVGVSVVVPLLVMAKWQNWPGGWSWGPRHLFPIHAFLAVPIAFWIAEAWTPARRLTLVALFAAGLGVQLLGCSQDFIVFHRLFFRDPAGGFRIPYDPYDEVFWRQHVLLSARHPRTGQWTPMPLSAVPAPIHLSIYDPRMSVWKGYPLMWREFGLVDNLWLRLLREGRPSSPPEPSSQDHGAP